MEKITKNNNYTTAVNSIVDSMTEEEYGKAVEFYKFLVNITKYNHGILSIDREKLIDIAAAYKVGGLRGRKTSPFRAGMNSPLTESLNTSLPKLT